MLARDLAEQGICIVSGLARGIDSAAHEGALQAKGKTIAVLGTGIDEVYPKENKKLVDEILEKGGAIVSQFPLGTPPLKDNFPYRNRIISGLSYAVLLTEATERSGSLITARLAMEQNREVLAVPGNITSRNSIGTNYLIKSGAKLVQQWQDVVAELPEEIKNAILPPKLDEKKEMPQQAELAPANLNENERKIWEILSPDEAAHIDFLFDESGLSFGDLNKVLFDLEMRELIRALPGKCYARKI
jgi:DNA processing protein